MHFLKSIVVAFLLVLAGLPRSFADSPPKGTDKQLEEAFGDIGQDPTITLIKKYLGYDVSVWWMFVRIFNSIPGDTKKFEPILHDPAYATLTMEKLQERLGNYIVAREAVSRLPSNPSKLASLSILDEEIGKMKAESLRRSH